MSVTITTMTKTIMMQTSLQLVNTTITIVIITTITTKIMMQTMLQLINTTIITMVIIIMIIILTIMAIDENNTMRGNNNRTST